MMVGVARGRRGQWAGGVVTGWIAALWQNRRLNFRAFRRQSGWSGGAMARVGKVATF